MPLDKNTRDIANHYIFNHVVPKTVKPRPQEAKEWFIDQFSFIDDSKLQKHLAEAFYQGRYQGRLKEALDLPEEFNQGFIKSQIILYASIFEAIIDHFLEKNIDDSEVQKMLSMSEYVPMDGALAKDISLVHKDGVGENPLTVCRLKISKRPLHMTRFDERVDAAHALGLVPNSLVDFIKNLYKSRNGIHVLNAAKKDLKPDANESSDAFRNIMFFLRHAKTWVKKQKVR